MSIKSKSRTLGRMLRRLTGIPLPICMKVGKMVVQGKNEQDIVGKFSPQFSYINHVCGDGCCSFPIFQLVGPKGTLTTEYSFSEAAITKEYKITMALSKVHLGTTISTSNL